MDIARRAAALYGDLVVVVMGNPDKGPGLSLERRAALLDKCLAGTPGLRVQVYRGLLADAVKTWARGPFSGACGTRRLPGRETGGRRVFGPVRRGDSIHAVQAGTGLCVQLRPGSCSGYGPAEGLLPEAIAQEIKSAYR